jgi:hypothetical protein
VTVPGCPGLEPGGEDAEGGPDSVPPGAETDGQISAERRSSSTHVNRSIPRCRGTRVPAGPPAMTASAPPPSMSIRQAPPGPRTLPFGSAVGVGAAAALASTLPAAIRVASVGGNDSVPRIWLALAAATLGPMVAAVLVLRVAREGLRPYAGPGAELRAYGVALWIASLLVTFAIFGSGLRATTHQHALAGVTFAFGAAAIAATSAVVCARIVAILRDASARVRNVLGALLALLAFLALSWVGMRFLRAIAQDPTSATAGGTVVDALAFTMAALFAARPSLSRRKLLALVGAPAALVIAVLGVATLRDAQLREAIDQRAPAFAPTVDLVPGQ